MEKVAEGFPARIASRISLPLNEELEAAAAEKALRQDGLHLPFFFAVDDYRGGRGRKAVREEGGVGRGKGDEFFDVYDRVYTCEGWGEGETVSPGAAHFSDREGPQPAEF